MPVLMIVFAVVATACGTVADTLPDEQASDPISFTEEESSPATSTTAPTTAGSGQADTTETPESSTTTFPPAPIGPTLVAAGPDGVWWYDADGPAQLLAERTVSADYDGLGGLVFQRSNADDIDVEGVGAEGEHDTTIVHHTNTAEQFDLVAPAVDEALELHGVTNVGAGPEAVFTRHSLDAGADATLERVSIETGEIVELATVGTPDRQFENVTVTGTYASGTVSTAEGYGWIIYELRTGARLSGSAPAEFAACPVRPTPQCRLLLTISGDGSRLHEIFPSGPEGENYELVSRQSNNGAEIDRIDLRRSEPEWFPQRLEPAGDVVIISRTSDPAGRVPLPALVVDVATGEITQLSSPGLVAVVASRS